MHVSGPEINSITSALDTLHLYGSTYEDHET